MTSKNIHTIFVYGTLQQGEERAPLWPRSPKSITPATVAAELYDLGPYPAIVTGSDKVGGEVWQLAPHDMAITLETLDEIECFGQEGVDLYVRKVVNCLCENGETIKAYTYFLADEQFARRQRRVMPDNVGVCRWHRYR